MIQRVFLSTINWDHPQRGMIDAFGKVFGRQNLYDFDYLELGRQGVPVPEVNRRFIEEAVAFKPDWCWLQLQNSGVISAATIEALKVALPKTIITHWMGDARDKVSDYLASICRATHASLIANIGHIPHYEAVGAKNIRYLQIGLDWDEDVLGLPAWIPPFTVKPVMFLGHNYGGDFPGTVEREAAIRALMDARVPIGICGRGWPAGFPVLGECGVKQQHHVWKRALVAISVNHFNDVEGHYSDRHLIAMASGIPLVTKRIPGLEKEFTDGKHLVMFDTNDELVHHVQRLLGDIGLRTRIGETGRREVLANHTWQYRILEVLPFVEGLRAKL